MKALLVNPARSNGVQLTVNGGKKMAQRKRRSGGATTKAKRRRNPTPNPRKRSRARTRRNPAPLVANGRRRGSSRRRRNPARIGIIGQAVEVLTGAAAVVAVQEIGNTLAPGLMTSPIAQIAGGLAIRKFLGKGKHGELAQFVGGVIAVNGAAQLLRPYVQQAVGSVTGGARSLLTGGAGAPVGEYFHLPDANLGEYVDLSEQADAYGY